MQAPASEHRPSSRSAIGNFDVDPEGRLSAGQADANLGMHFTWRGRPVMGDLHGETNRPDGHIQFRIRAGRVPSSAIAPDARPDAFALLACLPTLLPTFWTYKVGADHSLEFARTLPIVLPARVTDLLIPAVQFCLAAAPLLDLLDENEMGLA